MSGWRDVVSTVAPTIASALGGPLAGLAVGAIGEAFGLSEASQERIASAVLGAKPDDLLKLKQAEIAFAQRMRELEIDLVRIASDDRNSARQRESTVKDRLPSLLALVVSLGFFGMLSYMLHNEVPEKNSQVLNIMLGSLGTAWIQVMSYYFGSSSGSAAKTEIIGQTIKERGL
jgi:hypothetical protein